MPNYSEAAKAIKKSVLRDSAILLEKAIAALPPGRSRVDRHVVPKILDDASLLSVITRDELYNEVRSRKKEDLTLSRATTNTSLAAEALVMLHSSKPTQPPKKRKRGGNTSG